MKITKVTSHVLQYDLPELLGYSQQYYSKRSAHLLAAMPPLPGGLHPAGSGLGVEPDMDFIKRYKTE